MISGRKVIDDKTITFANSAAVDTQVTVDAIPDASLISGANQRCAVEVYNPSAVTDLRIKVFAIAASLGAGTRYCLIDTVTIPKSQTIAGTTINAHLRLIEGMFIGEGARFVVSNDTVLGGSDGFSAYMRIREV